MAHRAFSAAMNLPKSAGLPGRTSAPALSSRSFISAVARIFVIVACSLFTTSGDVPAGATMPWKEPVSKPGRFADSATVGTSGAAAKRFALEMARALSLPSFTAG